MRDNIIHKKIVLRIIEKIASELFTDIRKEDSYILVTNNCHTECFIINCEKIMEKTNEILRSHPEISKIIYIDFKKTDALETVKEIFKKENRQVEIWGYENLKKMCMGPESPLYEYFRTNGTLIQLPDEKYFTGETLIDMYRNLITAETLRGNIETASQDTLDRLRNAIQTCRPHFAPEHVTFFFENDISALCSQFNLIILKADLKGYSGAIEKCRGNNNSLVEAMKDWVRQVHISGMIHSAIIDKFMGDGIIAYFGFPNILDCKDSDDKRRLAESIIRFINEFQLSTYSLGRKLNEISEGRIEVFGSRISLCMAKGSMGVVLANSSFSGLGHLLAFSEGIVVADRSEKKAPMGIPIASHEVVRYFKDHLNLKKEYYEKFNFDDKDFESKYGHFYKLKYAKIGDNMISLLGSSIVEDL